MSGLRCASAYDDLPVTIEAGIEDTILSETVVRFGDGIAVGRLDGVMMVQDAEYREVRRLHDKCCRNVRAHSHAAGQQRPRNATSRTSARHRGRLRPAPRKPPAQGLVAASSGAAW